MSQRLARAGGATAVGVIQRNVNQTIKDEPVKRIESDLMCDKQNKKPTAGGRAKWRNAVTPSMQIAELTNIIVLIDWQ